MAIESKPWLGAYRYSRPASRQCIVIELKVGAADREAIDQLLAYMGDLMDDDAWFRGVLSQGNSRRALYRLRARFLTSVWFNMAFDLHLRRSLDSLPERLLVPWVPGRNSTRC